jgi:hypothetical protein
MTGGGMWRHGFAAVFFICLSFKSSALTFKTKAEILKINEIALLCFRPSVSLLE